MTDCTNCGKKLGLFRIQPFGSGEAFCGFKCQKEWKNKPFKKVKGMKTIKIQTRKSNIFLAILYILSGLFIVFAGIAGFAIGLIMLFTIILTIPGFFVMMGSGAIIILGIHLMIHPTMPPISVACPYCSYTQSIVPSLEHHAFTCKRCQKRALIQIIK